MSDIRFVVSALPRSGTRYIATVLQGIGVDCTHEARFGDKKSIINQPTDSVFGDSSWLSVPYLSRLPSGTTVFHQVRDPVKVINSNLPPDGDSYFKTWDEHAGLASDEEYKKPLPYKRFIWDNTQDWIWPETSEMDRLIHFWMNWNLWIEYQVCRRSDLTYIRYRLEDVDEYRLHDIAQIIGVIVPIENCKKVLSKVSKTTNRHRNPNTKFTVDMLPPAARLLMHRYGY